MYIIGQLNDLFQFDSATYRWTMLTADGAPGAPPAVFGAALAADAGALWRFGGVALGPGGGRGEGSKPSIAKGCDGGM